MEARYFRLVLCRDIEALCREIEAYDDEIDIWKVRGGIANSAGTLALHLAGNLDYFIGAVLGASGYVRDREKEFASRSVPRAELIAMLKNTCRSVARTFGSLTGADLDKPFPVEVMGLRLPTRLFLLHLCTHLAYHLGQADYHRRLTVESSGPVGAVRIADLATEALV